MRTFRLTLPSSRTSPADAEANEETATREQKLGHIACQFHRSHRIAYNRRKGRLVATAHADDVAAAGATLESLFMTKRGRERQRQRKQEKRGEEGKGGKRSVSNGTRRSTGGEEGEREGGGTHGLGSNNRDGESVEAERLEEVLRVGVDVDGDTLGVEGGDLRDCTRS